MALTLLMLNLVSWFIMTVYEPLTSAIRREPSISFRAKQFPLVLRLTNDTLSGKLLKAYRCHFRESHFKLILKP